WGRETIDLSNLSSLLSSSCRPSDTPRAICGWRLSICEAVGSKVQHQQNLDMITRDFSHLVWFVISCQHAGSCRPYKKKWESYMIFRSLQDYLKCGKISRNLARILNPCKVPWILVRLPKTSQGL